MSSPPEFSRGVSATLILIATGVLLPMGAEVHASDGTSEVEALDAILLENNRSIHAFDARIRQSEQEARALETQWPDPMVEYMLDISAPWAPHFTTGHMIRVMQTIPRGGARDAQAAPARAASEVARVEQQEAKADLWRDLRLDMIELARLDARIELLEEEIELIEDALRVVETVAPVERGDHGDFYQLELAAETATDDVESLRSRRGERRARMAARMGVEVEVVEGEAFPAQLLEEWLVEMPAEEQLVEMAQHAEPGLLRMEAEAEVASERIELVDEGTRPWPQVMAGYSNMPSMWEMDGSRAQMFQVGISVPLPLSRTQYDHEASQWQEARRAIEEDRAQMTEDLRGQIEELVTAWETDQRRLERFERELLPLATDLAEQVLIGIEVGERSASEFLLALRQEIDIEGRIIELRADQLVRLMELQRLTGGQLGADQAWAYPQTIGGQQ